MLPLLTFLGELILALAALFLILGLIVTIIALIVSTVLAIKGGKFINGQFQKAENRTSALQKWDGGAGFPR